MLAGSTRTGAAAAMVAAATAGLSLSASPAETADCGARDQPACTFLQRPNKPCDRGLRLTSLIGGRCVKPTGAEAFVKSLSGRTKGHQRAMSGIRNCMTTSGRSDAYRKALDTRDVDRAKGVLDPCLASADFNQLRKAPSGMPRSAGGAQDSAFFNTLNVGVAAGIQVIGGVGLEMGLVIDLNGQRNPRFYTVSETVMGIGLGMGGDVTVGLSNDLVPLGKTVSEGTSYNLTSKFTAGAGIAVNFEKWQSELWSTPMTDFDGFGVAAGIGAGADFLSKHQTVTTIW
jgi:hypothetical protein